jgi:hypothetical protein
MSFFKVSGIQKWCLSADQALRNAFDEAHSRAMERKQGSCIGSRSVRRAILGPAGECHTNTEAIPTGVNAGSAQPVDIKPSWIALLAGRGRWSAATL